MGKRRPRSGRQRGRRDRDSKHNYPHPTDFSEPRSEASVFAELTALCALPGYVHALSYLIFRDGVVTAGEEFKKEDFEKLYTRERLIRTEITTLIGLWLKGSRSLAMPDAIAIQNMVDRTDQLLAELHAAMLVPAREDFISAITARQSDPDVQSPLGKAAAMREAIFYSGESAFTFQYLDFARLRYAADSDWLRKNYGFDINTAADFFEKLIAYQSDQMPIRFADVRRTPMSEWTMLPIFCFTEQEAVQATGFSCEIVRNLISAFSVPADSKNARYADVFSFNEAAVLPFVRLEDGRIAFLQEYVATEALYNSPAYWMRTNTAYASKASKHRGEFAETLSFDLIKRAFPPDRIHQNIFFRPSKNKTAGEADLLLVQGKRAFVFQLKSKGLTEEARTGNELAVTRDFSAAVQHAYDQAVSCIDLLRNGVPTHKDGKPFTIPHIDGVEEFYPVCITSENYPALSYQVGQFLKRSEQPWVKAPIIMDLFTLDAITEFLRSPLYLIDYFAKRSLLFDKILSSHELVLLAYHLRRNLFVPEDVTMFMIEDDFMIELDLAMAVRRRGLPGADTPAGVLTRDLDNPVGRILAAADKTDRPEVHQLGELILNLSSDAWNDINRWVKGLAAQARRDHESHDVTVPLSGAGLTIHCNDWEDSRAFRKLASHCEVRKYVHKADRWFGVCLSETEELRFALGRIGAWEFNPKLESEAMALKVRSANHWVDVAGRRTKLGRNDPCPCGSGKKYKKCCLN